MSEFEGETCRSCNAWREASPIWLVSRADSESEG